MRKAGYDADGDAAWIAVEDPNPSRGFAVVETTVVPICTEYKYFLDGVSMARIGHEAVGRVRIVPDGSDLVPGDRVVVMPTWPCGECIPCREGAYVHCSAPRYPWLEPGYTSGADMYAELVIKPDWLLVPIPDSLDDETASMALCGLGPTFGAMQRLGVTSETTVLVVGQGPVGLGGVINALDRGARVIAVEPNPFRRELAARLGAEVVEASGEEAVEAVRALTDGIGADVAIDCSGIEAGRRVGLRAIRSLGALAFVGEGPDFTVHVSDELIRTGKQMFGSWHFLLGDTPELFDVLARQRERISTMITHRFPLERFREAWDLQATGNTGKVVLTR